MIAKPIAIVTAGMIAVILLSEPVFAAKTALSDEAIAEISGNANNYTISGNSSVTVSVTGSANANIQIDKYQWSDDHSSDQNHDKNANNQSGSASQVQQNITSHANALFVGSVSQNVLISNGGSIGNSQNLMAYSTLADGGF